MITRLSVVVFAAWALLFAGSIAEAQTARARIANTPIRGEASFASAIVATLSEGAAVEVIDLQGDWYRVRVPGEQGTPRFGYVRAHLIEIINADGSSRSIPVAPASRAAPRMARPIVPFSRGWLDVNVGASTAAERSLTTVDSFTLDFEPATVSNTYQRPRGTSFDVGGGYMFTPVVGLGLGLSGAAHSGTPILGIQIPHPTQFNASAIDSRAGDTKLSQVEGGLDVRAMINVMPESANLRLRVFGGPTLFRVKADTIDTVYFDQRSSVFLPQHSVTIQRYDFSPAEGSGLGFHAGADLAYFFSRVAGIGGLARFSRGIVTLSDASGPFKAKVGGFQTGGGLRMRF